ncbi:MAG: hypothetical protein DME13_06115 [Candidatus Rokuibacteriota bacterium]|nr:MAG: hypothetical protein DME13_06115 [Candidatus Rokubacteria bacterium]
MALAALTVLAVADFAAAAAREDELKRVINRNTGFAHTTRGMNMYTPIALRSCVTDADLPVLRRLLFDRDYVTQLSAAGVLVDMGAGGRAALVSALPEATEYRARSTIQDALREGRSGAEAAQRLPARARERKRIRGCRAAAH